MTRVRNRRGSAFAYGSALVVSAAMIAGGVAVATYFRTHLGSPPPIIVVAEGPPASTTPPVPTTRTATTTPKPVAPPEQIPPRVPDGQAYTAAVPAEAPLFNGGLANQYGWFGGDVDSARCDEWQHASVVGNTERMLFVVCGAEFKAYDLRYATPIRLGVSGGGGSWSGSGGGVSVQLTSGELTVIRDGQPVTQPVLQWWTP